MDWEKAEIILSVLSLESASPTDAMGKDEIAWQPDSRGVFTSRSAWDAIKDHGQVSFLQYFGILWS